MDAAHLIQIAVQASILLLVFALGLRASYEDATYLLRRPGLLARALVAMYVVVPVSPRLWPRYLISHRPLKSPLY